MKMTRASSPPLPVEHEDAPSQPPMSAYEALQSELENKDDSDEDSYSEEEVEEEVEQLTEWFPPDLGWVRVNHDAVVVTDVTVNDMTVTMRESKQPEGFFSYSH